MKKRYIATIGVEEIEIYLNDKEVKHIEDYGKCLTDKVIDIRCSDGTMVKNSSIDDYKIITKIKLTSIIKKLS